MLNKEEAKKELENLIKKYEKNRSEIFDKGYRYNEADAREQYIDPLLNIFGWDVHNNNGKNLSDTDVIVENYINHSNRADYVLRKDGVIFYTIEAEKPQKDIHKDFEPSQQVIRYGWNANNNIGFLINFEYFQIFQTTNKPVKDKFYKPWKDIKYDEYIEKFDFLWSIFSRESVYSGDAKAIIDEITPESATKEKLDKSFLRELDTWRIDIGNDLLQNDFDTYNNKEKLNNDVQTFIEQIIFLRFAEDNKLEKQKNKNELEFIFDDVNINPDDFENKLKILDKKYNSGIFKNSDIAKKLSQKTIKKIIESLYYPQSVYNFAMIDISILGKIYENFLKRELFIVGKSIQLRENGKKSIVNTPQEITNFITRISVGEKISKINNVDEILDLKIADLSVGAGTFLISSYDQIENRIREIQGKSLNDNIDISIKKKIIKDVLHGYDIDKRASRLTKFSLALRILKNESALRFRGKTPIIPFMDKNILDGNSLISKNDIEEYIEHKRNIDLNELEGQIRDINPSNYEKSKFDIILGNPPYLETKYMRKGPSIEFDIYKRRYQSSIKQFDKYFLFIEKSLKSLKQNGSATLIVPNKFFKIDTGKKLRQLIIKNGYLNKIYDYRDVQIFDNETIYVAIIKLSKNNKKMNYKYFDKKKNKFNENFHEYSYYDMQDDLGNWLFLYDDELKIYKRMSKYPRLTDILYIKNGIQTSCNKVYFFKDSDVYSMNNKYVNFLQKGKIVTIEKEILKPCFKNINKKGTFYQKIKADSWVIFPYFGDGKLIPIKKMKERYPNCFEYLKSNIGKLLPKKFGGKRSVDKNTKEDEWYKFGRNQGLTGWNKDKLIVGILSKGPSTSYDKRQLLIASGGTAGYLPLFLKNKNYDLEYVQAWINYMETDKMFKMETTVFNNGYWTHGSNVMKRIPFLTINWNKNNEKNIYFEIVKDVKEINSTDVDKLKEILIDRVNNLITKLLEIKGI